MRDEVRGLKDEIKGLEGENEELKAEDALHYETAELAAREKRYQRSRERSSDPRVWREGYEPGN